MPRRTNISILTILEFCSVVLSYRSFYGLLQLDRIGAKQIPYVLSGLSDGLFAIKVIWNHLWASFLWSRTKRNAFFQLVFCMPHSRAAEVRKNARAIPRKPIFLEVSYKLFEDLPATVAHLLPLKATTFCRLEQNWSKLKSWFLNKSGLSKSKYTEFSILSKAAQNWLNQNFIPGFDSKILVSIYKI